MKRNFLKASLAGLAFAVVGFTPLAHAQDKGLIAISMPTKSSARWIADGANMVKYFKDKGYKTDLQYAEDDIPNQLAMTSTFEPLVTMFSICASWLGMSSSAYCRSVL